MTWLKHVQHGSLCYIISPIEWQTKEEDMREDKWSKHTVWWKADQYEGDFFLLLLNLVVYQLNKNMYLPNSMIFKHLKINNNVNPCYRTEHIKQSGLQWKFRVNISHKIKCLIFYLKTICQKVLDFTWNHPGLLCGVMTLLTVSKKFISIFHFIRFHFYFIIFLLSLLGLFNLFFYSKTRF